MSREIKKDFKGLKSFFIEYNLRSLENNNKLLDILTQQHKKYFSFLTFIAELGHQREGLNDPSFSVQQNEYIKESCSDIGNSIFVMMHGAYKPSRMMLRSSIETFLKGFNGDVIDDVFKEKSMFTLFDDVRDLNFFKLRMILPIINSIHSDYKDLCKDIHTATNANMDNLTALEYFPSFRENSAKSMNKISIRLMSNYLILLSLKYNTCLLNMHHRNREIIIDNIPKSYKKCVLGIEPIA